VHVYQVQLTRNPAVDMHGRERSTVDLYAVLGVERCSTQEEIRSQYKQLAMKYHPDKNPSGAEKFKEITAAYKVLGDRDSRMQYDTNVRKVYTLADLQAELTPRDLKEFVDDLVRTERTDEDKRRSFEKRREEEMQRRAAFEAAHPNFRMSSYSYKEAPKTQSRSVPATPPQAAITVDIEAQMHEFRNQNLGRNSFFGFSSASLTGSPNSSGSSFSAVAAPTTSSTTSTQATPPAERMSLSRSTGDLTRHTHTTAVPSGSQYKEAMLQQYRASRMMAAR